VRQPKEVGRVASRDSVIIFVSQASTNVRLYFVGNTAHEQSRTDLAIHIIADNYATHKHPRVKKWLGRHPRAAVNFAKGDVACSDLDVEPPVGTRSRARCYTNIDRRRGMNDALHRFGHNSGGAETGRIPLR
jgi:hypothetical protein